jgi:hypothetical protein
MGSDLNLNFIVLLVNELKGIEGLSDLFFF